MAEATGLDIFAFWHSGTRPPLVEACLARWRDLNPGRRVHVLTASDLRTLVDDLPFDIDLLPVQARADILRVRVLRRYGGAWVDATLLPVVPIDRWWDTYLGTSGIFVYSGPPAHFRYTNFLILARPGHPAIAALDDAIRAYWTHPRRIVDETPGKLSPRDRAGRRLRLRALTTRGMGLPYLRFYNRWFDDLLYPVSDEGRRSSFFPYFWQQYLMMQLADRDPVVRAAFDGMTYRHHDLCHGVQNALHGLGEDFPKAIPMALRGAPVQKLDWRVDWPATVFDMPPQDAVLI